MGQRLQYIVHLHCSCLTPLPALCCFYYQRTLLAPCLPLFLFPTSSSTSSEHVPGEDHCSFFPFILRARHLENRLCVRHSPSHSIIPMFIQLSALSTVPFSLPLFPPVFLSMLTMSQLLTTALLIRVLHLSISIVSLSNCFLPHHLASARCLYLWHFLCLSLCPRRCCIICIV